MQNAPKPIKPMLHATPEAQAYWKDLREKRLVVDAVPEFDEPTCEACGGLGIVSYALPVDHPRFGQVFPCPNKKDCPTLKKQRAEQYAKLCTLAQIPKEYQDLTFADWYHLFEVAPQFQEGKQDAFGAALAFVAARERGFMFTQDDAAAAVNLPQPENASEPKCSIVYTGINGVGKTTFAINIARELIDVYRIQVVYLLMDEFFAALHERFEHKKQHEFAPEADDTAELIRLYQQAPVLIMDEFPHKPGKSEWWIQSVYQLVNYRHNHHLPTVITTNLDDITLLNEWGGAVGSRLQKMAHWYVVGGLEVRRRADMVVSR